MPEMTDAMYCHQQICIPPTFPYLLRQYAKAAIRSQPNDLLRWSCAYFRSLALGCRPPAKLRLEYPIPRTHFGLTPGWLKTLMHQLSGHNTISWPQLFDRWRGACLQIEGLQEIILLAEFNDPAHIPWLKFVAVAAGHLTTNLTNTMILICELLTEEPEGGSASIPFPIFSDLYKFLAEIDACETREVKNYWFTESNLGLTKEAEETLVTLIEEVPTVLTIKSESVADETEKDRFSDLRRYLKTIDVGEVEEEIKITPKAIETEEISETPLEAPEANCYIILDPEDEEKVCDEVHSKETSSSSGSSSEQTLVVATVDEKLSDQMSDETEYQTEITEGSQLETLSSTLESSEISKECKIFKLVAVSGIGGGVKEEIVDAVLKYLQEVAHKQMGMIMPRNIKHFLCPPLEECYD